MPSPPPDQDPRPASVDVGTRLREERAALSARVAHLTEDMASFFEASRDSNADDEHDPEGQTIAFERAQLSAVTDQALTAPSPSPPRLPRGGECRSEVDAGG